MDNPDQQHSASADALNAMEEKRAQPRVALLVRSAKLVCESGEFLCVVRDVSESGLRLRMFHALPSETQMELELASGERFPIDPMWQDQDEAGFQFAGTIDVDRFIAEASPYPKRPIRLNLTASATIVAGGETIAATIRDLSRQGARLEIDRPLPLKQSLMLRARGLPELEAVVAWRKQPEHGIVFRQVLSFDELAVRAADLQLGQNRRSAAGH